MNPLLTQLPDAEHSGDPSPSESPVPATQAALEERLWLVEAELADTRKHLYETLARLKFLEQSNAQVAFLDNVTEGVVFTNADDEVTYANPHALRIVGVESHDQVLSQKLFDALWESCREKERLFEDLRAGRYVRERECVWRNLRDERLVLICNATPVRDKTGAYVGGALALRDITAKRALELELRQQNEAYLKLVDTLQSSLNRLRETQNRLMAETNLSFASNLSASLVHELSDAVSVIEVRAYVLDRTAQTNAAMRTHVQQIHEAVERIAAVADSLRNLPRHRESPAGFDLRDVLDEVLLELRVCQYLDGCEVAVDRPTVPVQVEGRRMQVQQAVRNIIVNASEALTRLPAGSPRRLALQLGADGACASIGVSDNGPGFDSRVLEHLFRPGNSTKVINGHAGGLGLGLFVAHQVVRAHDGSLVVKSAPGAGATVTLSLPLVSPHPKA